MLWLKAASSSWPPVYPWHTHSLLCSWQEGWPAHADPKECPKFLCWLEDLLLSRLLFHPSPQLKTRALCPSPVGGLAFLTFPPSLPRLDPLQKSLLYFCLNKDVQSVLGFVSSPKPVALPDVLSTLRVFVLGEKWSLWFISHRRLREYIKAQHTLDLPHFSRVISSSVFMLCTMVPRVLLKTSAAVTGVLIWLLVRWGKFSPGRRITCWNIINVKISGSPNLVFKVETGKTI